VPLERLNGHWRLNAEALPAAVREPSGLGGHVRIGCELPVPDGVTYVARMHPLVEDLGLYLAGTALDTGTAGIAARCGAICTRAVTTRTTLLLLRLRLHLDVTQKGQTTPLLAEECPVSPVSTLNTCGCWRR
jgi:hypothetical protein